MVGACAGSTLYSSSPGATPYGGGVDEAGVGSLGGIASLYVDAVCAVAEATDKASELGRASVTAAVALEHVAALRRVIVMQREALAVFDRFIAGADQIGVAWEDVARLRETRAGIVLQLLDAINAFEQVDRAYFGSDVSGHESHR